ncbi:MAG: FtsX-like permease family protein [Candidatus Heimdallarchaeota archaeon]|nr:MAG: FtsX-like permease family protein [Candidatus Heimdallarchaeota archaeon]
MGNLRLFLKWSFRDLRQRKIQVLAIAIIIGLGTGIYTGLSSSTPWRQQAFEESNKDLNMFDLKIQLLPGSWIPQAELSSALQNLSHKNWIDVLEYRVSFPTTINASTSNQTILVNGRIIGINVSDGSQNLDVNGIYVTDGRHIKSTETAEDICLVEHNFASYHNLKPKKQFLTITGGIKLSFIGTALTPEYFVVNEENLVYAQSSFAALFVPLEAAQRILQQATGLPLGYVNEVVILTTPEANLEELIIDLKDYFQDHFSLISFEYIEKEDYPAYKFQEEDISGDQSLYYIFSFLILIIAAFGAYNLISRVVNSQRREIGINMALGVSPRQIAYRYLLFSLEIALGGIIFGYIFAIILGNRFGEVITDLLPYHVWKEWLVTELFLQGTLLGILIPFIASIVPIWRATRIQPIHAIQTGPKVSSGRGISPLLTWIRLPSSIFIQFPIRNISRNLRRAVSTLTGIALAICVLAAVLGFVDGADFLLESEQKIIKGDSEGRIDVLLNNLYNTSQSPVTNITKDTDVRLAVPMIQIPVTLHGEHESYTIVLRCFNFSNPIWSPETIREVEPYILTSGIIISQEAARDLKVEIGDEITLEHPYRKSALQYSKENTTFQVIGIQNSKIRFWAFCDISNDQIFNVTGLVNAVMILPKEGITEESIQQNFFNLQGYNGIQSVIKMVKVYEELIEMFRSIFDVIQYVVLILALLLVYNTTTVNIDERTRELATMAAFGTPIRTSSLILMVESMILGFLGTITGYFLFSPFVVDILEARVDQAMNEIWLTSFLYPDSLIILILIGIVLVTLTPLLSIRKLIKMDLTSALRVVE